MDKTYRLAGFVLILMVLVCGVVFGDGKAFPTLAVKVAPDIPSQRAVLAYRDGVETLIIESAFDGDGKEFGWVIPLPNVPTEFEAASAGFIEVLSSETQPYIRDHLRIKDTQKNLLTVGLWALFVLVLKVRKRIVSFILLAVILFVVQVVVPEYSSAGKDSHGLAPVRGVEVIRSEEVGSYGLAVLDAENSDGLDEWLTANGFVGLNEQERGIVSDYIEEGWCFVAAKLKRDGEGYSVPHPLSMKFESDRAVYPMRLTGMVGSNVYLELFVIADKGAEAEGLTLEFADRFEKDVQNYSQGNLLDKDIEHEGFAGSRYGRHRIGHPESFKVMWDSCFVSRLCGEMEPMQMDKDIVVQFADMEPSWKQYYSKKYVANYGFNLGGAICYGIIIVCMFIFHNRVIGERGRRFAFVMIILPAILIGYAIAGVTYISMEKVEATTTYNHRFHAAYLNRDYERLVLIAAGADGFEGMTKKEVTGVFEKALITYRDTYSVRAMEFGDGPRDFEILEDGRGVVFRVYLEGGFPMDYVLDEWLEGVKERERQRGSIKIIYSGRSR